MGLEGSHQTGPGALARQRLVQRPQLDRIADRRAAAVRLRPILMTTAAMVFGVLPLLVASGAGAESRFSIGLVITAGMSIGTVFTLFAVPVLYTFFARDRREHDNSATRLPS